MCLTMIRSNRFTFFKIHVGCQKDFSVSMIIHIMKCESSCAASTLTCWSLLLHFDKVSTTLVVELSFTAIIE